MKTARYSNGYTDTYKGNRNITAGWMVITPSGRIESGHSIDLPTATKTARNCAANSSGIHVPTPSDMKDAHRVKMWIKISGTRNIQELKEWAASQLLAKTDYISKCKIEIVNLEEI